MARIHYTSCTVPVYVGRSSNRQPMWFDQPESKIAQMPFSPQDPEISNAKNLLHIKSKYINILEIII